MFQEPAAQVVAWLIVLALGLWGGVWMLVALWKAARRDQPGWFIACALLSFAGFVPMLYIFFVAPKAPEIGEEPF